MDRMIFLAIVQMATKADVNGEASAGAGPSAVAHDLAGSFTQ